jgi:hypothetical protein
MTFEDEIWTRRQSLIGLTMLFGATGQVGCGPEGAGSVNLKNSGGKFGALREKGKVLTKARRGQALEPRGRTLGPDDMRPADKDQ